MHATKETMKKRENEQIKQFWHYQEIEICKMIAGGANCTK